MYWVYQDYFASVKSLSNSQCCLSLLCCRVLFLSGRYLSCRPSHLLCSCARVLTASTSCLFFVLSYPSSGIPITLLYASILLIRIFPRFPAIDPVRRLLSFTVKLPASTSLPPPRYLYIKPCFSYLTPSSCRRASSPINLQHQTKTQNCVGFSKLAFSFYCIRIFSFFIFESDLLL